MKRMQIVKLPRKHAQDWFSRRDTETSRILSVTARTITIEICPDDLADLISDAKYYASEMGPDNTGDIDYRPAARTCLKSLEKQGYIK